MLKFVPPADGIGSDSGFLAISDETRQYLDIVLAAAALCTSGLRESFILGLSQDHPWFSLENEDVGT